MTTAIRLTTATGASPYFRPPATVAGSSALSAIGTLDGLAQSVPLDAPWTAPNADALDASTIESWLVENVSRDDARDLLRLAVESVYAAGPGEVSFLDLLASIRGSGGSFFIEINTEGGAQDSRFVGGSQLLSQRGRLSAPPPAAPVTMIIQDGG
jgi:monoamine oxidase